MLKAKEIAFISIFTALLIGGQLVLSGISGIEVVTVLLLSFSFYFGIKCGLFVANAFSLLRCFIFGFFIDVLILYLVYYNLFVVVFGLLGNKFKHTLNIKRHAVILVFAVVMTVFFTLLSDVITPLYYRMSIEEAKAFFIASLTAVIPQTVCALVTVLFLLPVLVKLYSLTKYRQPN